MTYLRFETGREDRMSADLGPFDFLQLTYDTLRIAPDGETVAELHDGEWRVANETLLGNIAQGSIWSDVVIWGAA